MNRREASATILGLVGLAGLSFPKGEESRAAAQSALAKSEGTLDYSERASSVINRAVLDASAQKLPVSRFDTRNTHAVQAIVDQWDKYSEEVKQAFRQDNASVLLKAAQEKFVAFIQTQARTDGIPRINLKSDAMPELNESVAAAEAFAYLLPAVLAKRGIVIEPGDGKIQWAVTHDGGTDKAFAVRYRPDRFYAVVQENDPNILALLPHVAESKVALFSVQKIGGEYQKDANNSIIGVGSFATPSGAFLNLDLVQDKFVFARDQKEAYIRNIAAICGKPLADVIRLTADAALQLAPTGQSVIDRLRDGGVAIDRLIYSICTDGRKADFDWQRYRISQIRELVSHEAQHCVDFRNDAKTTQVVELVRNGTIAAKVEDRIEAETLAETHVRLESMLHSPAYFLVQLIAEQRFGFDLSIVGAKQDDVMVRGANGAKQTIFNQMISELRENPDDYGVRLDADTPGLAFSTDQKIMAQIDHVASDPKRVQRMVEAILKRAKVDQRKELLLSKYPLNK